MAAGEGFEFQRRRLSRFLLRSDIAADLRPLFEAWARGELPPARPLLGGRGGVGLYDTGQLRDVVLRPSRRGGLMASVNRDLYFGFRYRPFREVRHTEILLQRGVPTVQVLGCCVHLVAPGCYRAVVASAYAVGAVNLWEYLRAAPPQDRARACEVVARATRTLHDAGGVHPDLNLQNYLVRRSRGDHQVLIIDCDKIALRAVTAADRRAAFARLCRSIRRLDPESAIVTYDCVRALRQIQEPVST